MSYQVGPWCYATAVDAAAATCSSFASVTALLPDGSVRTVSCVGSTAMGGLRLRTVSTPSTGGASTINIITQQIDFPPCSQDDVIAAGLTIFGSLLTAGVVCWALFKVAVFLNWSRAEK